MSVSTTIKKALMAKIAAQSSVQATYGHEELNPSGNPAVMVTAGDMEGEFTSDAENSRIYAFRIFIIFQVGQDYSGPSETNRMEYAEQVIATVIDDIINVMDLDYDLTDTNPPVLYMEAADVTWGYVNIEGGEARTAELFIRAYTEKRVK